MNPVKEESLFNFDYFSFNFSFGTDNKNYHIARFDENRIYKALHQKIHRLSQESTIKVAQLSKKSGLERLPELTLKKSILSKSFYKAKLDETCDSGFWVFRISKFGRVLAKRNGSVLYLIAVDVKFNLYTHGA